MSNVHSEHWSLTFNERRKWIDSHVRIELVKRRLVTTTRKRLYSNIYSLPNDKGILQQVYQKVFLNTLGYTSNSVINSFKKAKVNSAGLSRNVPRGDLRGKTTSNRKYDEMTIQEHIKSFKPMPSHYKREHAPNACTYHRI